MELRNSRQLPVARDVAWIALNDPGVLQGCIPGCESIERIDDTTWTIVVAATLGPVGGRWTGRIKLTDVVVPTSYTLNFDGLGSSAGLTHGRAVVTLQPQGPMNTLITYDLKAQFGGEFAGLDTPQVDGAASKLADTFFRRLTTAIAPHHKLNDPVAADGEVAAALATDAAMRDMPSTRGKMARWWPWAAALLILIFIVMWGNHAG
ncbi:MULTISPECIES: carbon monoxide dehydrogenase subunit G [Pandoraea]|uniref:CoxG family protein n=1 Tax=Pandoraea TaxID=93217 RepID=UPI001F5DEBAA|nr:MULTISPECIES: carbon monoxide dehydrogenase subunit G [Pandoraea]MCI3205620.1 carbon monoxide dehydrogenase [Pandoraea sp. LA3]MDN4583648.1 carbon monoxide dehydrogenase [Pandoraea capi]